MAPLKNMVNPPSAFVVINIQSYNTQFDPENGFNNTEA